MLFRKDGHTTQNNKSMNFVFVEWDPAISLLIWHPKS